MVGVSGGGPYALAAAHYLPPGRVRGVLTISSPAPAGAWRSRKAGQAVETSSLLIRALIPGNLCGSATLIHAASSSGAWGLCF